MILFLSHPNDFLFKYYPLYFTIAYLLYWQVNKRSKFYLKIKDHYIKSGEKRWKSDFFSKKQTCVMTVLSQTDGFNCRRCWRTGLGFLCFHLSMTSAFICDVSAQLVHLEKFVLLTVRWHGKKDISSVKEKWNFFSSVTTISVGDHASKRIFKDMEHVFVITNRDNWVGPLPGGTGAPWSNFSHY